MNNYPLILLYDGKCALCAMEMQCLMLRNQRGLLRFIDASAYEFDPEVFGVNQSDVMRSLHAIRPDGSIAVGVNAIRLAYNGSGYKFLSWTLGVPGIKSIAEWLYPRFADNRYVLSLRFRWLIDLLNKRRSCREDRCESKSATSKSKCQ